MPATGMRVGRPFGLRLDESPTPSVTPLRDGDGGAIFADVIRHTDGSELLVRKQLGETHIEDFEVEVATLTSTGLIEWIAASWTQKPPKRDGALLAFKYDLTIAREQAFAGALITETVIPTLDAAVGAPAVVTVRFAAASSAPVAASGSKLAFPLAKGAQKLWLSSNFKLQIAALDCSKVSRIEAFTVRRTIESVSGHGHTLTAGVVDFPDLRVFLSASTLPTWAGWHQDFVVDGHNGAANERTGSIQLLAPDLATQLARIDLFGLGIHRLDQEDDVPANQIARYVADLYCEQMVLIPGGTP
jgi:hypothetical protein